MACRGSVSEGSGASGTCIRASCIHIFLEDAVVTPTVASLIILIMPTCQTNVFFCLWVRWTDER